jgi:hypothetical protein
MTLGSVIGDILPQAVAVAISPVPIIAVILMLFSSRPRRETVYASPKGGSPRSETPVDYHAGVATDVTTVHDAGTVSPKVEEGCQEG